MGRASTDYLFYKLPAEIASRRDLPAACKVVVAAIIDCVGENDCCWAGVRTLARKAGVNVSTVLESLERLEGEKIMRIERRGNGRSNRYYLTLESARKIQALGKSEHRRSENPSASARKIRT